MIPPSMFDYWGKRDPIGLYEAHLINQGMSEATLAEVERQVTEEVDRAAEEALESRESNMPPPDSAMDDVYAS